MNKSVLNVVIHFILFAPWVMALLWDKVHSMASGRYGIHSRSYSLSMGIYQTTTKMLLLVWLVFVAYMLLRI